MTSSCGYDSFGIFDNNTDHYFILHHYIIFGSWSSSIICMWCTVYPKKYAHGFVVLCFVMVMQSFIMNSHEVFIHIHQGCFAGTGAIVRLPQCQWSKPDGYGKISQRITTTKHSKAKTVCIFLGIYCTALDQQDAVYTRRKINVFIIDTNWGTCLYLNAHIINAWVTA